MEHTAIKGHLRVREIVLFALLGALMFVAKLALAAFPNVEPVSLLVMLYAVTLGRKGLYPVYIYILLEYAFWGIHLWCINYLYIWLILFVVARMLREMQSAIGWAVVSGVFGLFFGMLCAPVYLFSGGWQFMVSWWLSGIPMDVVHCVGNFVIALLLFKPMRALLEQLMRRF